MWQGLEEFIQVVEQGSFTNAAKIMDVSTSHISRQINQLEKRLGTILIKRTTRKISLTDAGRQYFISLKNIRQELIEATDHLQGTQQVPKGLIRLTGAGDFVADQVAPILAQFMKKYPEVEIEINFSGRNVNLIEEGFDLAIRFGRMQDSSLIARPLTTRFMSLVATPDYLEQHGIPKVPEDLLHHNCLMAITNRWRFNINDEIKEIKVHGNWRSNHAGAILQACFSDLGIAHLAKDLVQKYIDNKQLVYVLDDYQVSDNATWLVYPRKDLIPHRVRLLIDFLLAHF
ncbi:LysR family transcriptional regulator [Pseudoalteromonas denitrificans]|uniref:DNA-binding transcriptional regulator, LysR family n=1 Tax=Pseudoalteromonas denitrificans DSM 6059 TaxID=1123010 RepID=A0A1I1TNY8_9GAMM|nr:LysR family transcriptional regulator [Pseudoalteromonas denitrificans]SFD60219.1 DNA-binding transcriptional regulator, LysR family [Pseudoalteromonas denitrificans DSM 6059]